MMLRTNYYLPHKEKTKHSENKYLTYVYQKQMKEKGIFSYNFLDMIEMINNFH
jgi:hypothetical protein